MGKRGFEPRRLAAHDPKSCSSASSDTSPDMKSSRMLTKNQEHLQGLLTKFPSSRKQGFNLVELLIATAITGLVVSFLGTAIYQIITVTDYGNDRLAVMRELQNAAHWVSRDG